jgi:hypothetical protein
MAGNPDDRDRDLLDAEGIPDLETPINQDEGIMPPGDAPIAADEWGVTAAEERLKEPIAERVTREVPDVRADDIDERDADLGYGALGEGDALDGRLLEPGSEDVGLVDDEKDAIASLVGSDDDEGALSAEEAALHVTDITGGGVDDDLLDDEL